MDWQGAAEITDAFRSWFGAAEEFEVLDTTVGGVGWHVIEQHGYADAGPSICRLDLLCSGFHPDVRVAPDVHTLKRNSTTSPSAMT